MIKPNIRKALGCLILISAVGSGCSDNTKVEPWDVSGEQESPSIVPTYCPLPNDNLNEPSVTRETGESWRVRYPSFQAGCGAYQLDVVFDFTVHDESPLSYEYDIVACNRCEGVHAWSYLHQLGTKTHGTPEKIPVPEPTITEVDALLPHGLPIVQHTGQTERHPLIERCRTSGGVGLNGMESFAQYSNLLQIHLTPNSRQEIPFSGQWSLGADQAPRLAEMMLLLNSSSADGNTEILWPRLRPVHANISGKKAVSSWEYCNYPGQYFYDVPYQVEEKYYKQSLKRVGLPLPLLEKLESIAQQTN